MKKISLLLLLTTFMVGTSYAGGSILGGSKRRSSNPDGVSSVGMKICNSLNCPDVIIKQGDCGDIEHAIQQYGVCVCEEGYLALNGVCVPKESSEGGSETETCISGIVKVYNCETKTTTDCCPDTETCEQPVCTCNGDDDCPGQQECWEGTCSCPDGGSESETVSGVCCKNGGAWHNTRMKYAAMNIEACGGCPEDGIESEKTPGICCKDGKAWSAVEGYDDVYSYNKWDPACNEFNCPEDAMEGVNFATTGVCCSTSGGFEYDNGVLNIQECGCPYMMGEPSETQPNVCCSNGGARHPDWSGYYAVNVTACQGCPTSPISGNKGTISTDTSTCCYNGKAWSDEEPDYTKISSSCS